MTRSAWPKISIVVPSFRQGRFLEAALRSVLDQGYPELELLVADGGSDDGSVEILERYDTRLTWWTSGPDGGQAHAINKGLERATGDVVGWLNSDDQLLPGSLRTIARAFRSPRVNIVCGLRRRIDEEGQLIGRWVRDLPTRWYLRHYCCVPQETVYWRRKVLDKVGRLDEDLHYALDYDYWLRCVEAGFDFTFLPAYLGAIREHEATKTSTLHHVFRRDMALLYRRYGLGRSEEEVHGDLGRHWSWHLALLEDLGDSPLSASPRLVGAFLRALDYSPADAWVSRVYRRFRERRPRDSPQAESGNNARPAAARALVGALVAELRHIPIEARPEPYLRRATAISRPRLPWRDIRPEDLEPAPLGDGAFAAGELPDSLVLGSGWSWLEESVDDVYRWASQDAEILVLRPSGARTLLRLELQTGPSLEWRPFEVRVLDEEDGEVARLAVEDRDYLELALPLTAGSEARCFRLRVDGEARPVSETDPRIMRFRLTDLGWVEDDPMVELPSPAGRPAVIVAAPTDVAPARHVRRLERLRPRRRPPSSGLFPGRGWLALSNGAEGPRRRAVGAAEVVLTRPVTRRGHLTVGLVRNDAHDPPLLHLWGRGSRPGPGVARIEEDSLVFELGPEHFDPEPKRGDAQVFRLAHPQGAAFTIHSVEWSDEG